MPDPRVYSTEAIAHATLQLMNELLRRLVERAILTEDQVTSLFDQATATQRALSEPGNLEAAALLAEIGKPRDKKFR